MPDYNRLSEEICAYLEAKFPDVGMAEKMEATEYLCNRVCRFLRSALDERDEEWKRHLKSHLWRQRRAADGE